MKLATLIKALVGYVGARFLGAGLGLVTQLVLARALLPADVSIVFMAMSAAAFLSLLMTGGQSLLATTHLPKLLARGESGTINAFHAAALRSLVYVLATLVPLWLLAWQFQLLRGDILLALGVGLIAAPMSALARYNAMVANSLRWFPLSYVPDFIARPGLFLIAVLCLILASLHHNVGLVLLCFVAFVWVVALGQSLLMQGKGLRLQHWSNYQPAYARVILPRSAAMLIVAAVSFATADIVMLLAGFLLPPEQAAVAGVTVRLAAIAGFVLQAGQLFVLPDFAAAVARRDTTQGNALLWRVNGLTLLVIIAALVAALLLGRMVLSFFGEIYTDGAVLLTLFLVGQSIRALGGMNQSLLAIEGHQVRTAGACILALAVLVVCAAIFCRHLGLVGLGYAVIAAECAWLLALAMQAQQHCRRRADLLWLARNA